MNGDTTCTSATNKIHTNKENDVNNNTISIESMTSTTMNNTNKENDVSIINHDNHIPPNPTESFESPIKAIGHHDDKVEKLDELAIDIDDDSKDELDPNEKDQQQQQVNHSINDSANSDLELEPINDNILNQQEDDDKIPSSSSSSSSPQEDIIITQEEEEEQPQPHTLSLVTDAIVDVDTHVDTHVDELATDQSEEKQQETHYMNISPESNKEEENQNEEIESKHNIINNDKEEFNLFINTNNIIPEDQDKSDLVSECTTFTFSTSPSPPSYNVPDDHSAIVDIINTETDKSREKLRLLREKRIERELRELRGEDSDTIISNGSSCANNNNRKKELNASKEDVLVLDQLLKVDKDDDENEASIISSKKKNQLNTTTTTATATSMNNNDDDFVAILNQTQQLVNSINTDTRNTVRTAAVTAPPTAASTTTTSPTPANDATTKIDKKGDYFVGEDAKDEQNIPSSSNTIKSTLTNTSNNSNNQRQQQQTPPLQQQQALTPTRIILEPNLSIDVASQHESRPSLIFPQQRTTSEQQLQQTALLQPQTIIYSQMGSRDNGLVSAQHIQFPNNSASGTQTPARRTMKLVLEEERRLSIPEDESKNNVPETKTSIFSMRGLRSKSSSAGSSGGVYGNGSSERPKKSRSFGNLKDEDVVGKNLNLGSSTTIVDRGSISVSWYEGTTTVELQDHVRKSVERKLGLGSKKILRDFRVLDASVDPKEEIVLSSYIPHGSEFLCQFRIKDISMQWKRQYRAPDSPSAAPSPPGELERLQDQIKTIVESQENAKSKPFLPNISNKEESDSPRKNGLAPNVKDEVAMRNELLSLRLEKLSGALLQLHEDGPYSKEEKERYRPVDKRQVVFTIANYFILFLSLIALSAEIHERAPKWLEWINKNVTSVQNCAADRDALRDCVSQGDIAGLIAYMFIWGTTNVATKRLFLFGFDTPMKLWIAVYEAGVTAFCWGCSYMFIRRGLNPDTRPNFLVRYWKDAVYGSLAGFNAAFMKAVLKNLIPQEQMLDALDQRQTRIVSFLEKVFT